MTDPSQVPPAPPEPSSGERLDSWKEIAAYVRRDVKTVQRWEKREGMPVHRHLHDKGGSVYAFRTELDEWEHNRRLTPPDSSPVSLDPEGARAASAAGTPAHGWRRRWPWVLAVLGTLAALAAAAVLRQAGRDVGPRLTDVKFLQLTDFGGIEQAAAISRDGELVAFLSDRDGRMDVWLTRVGSGEFHNLTRGAAGELVNASVRTLGFSPDGSLVTFWARRVDGSQRSEINIWGIPVLGGAPRVYLEGVAEYDWSDDGTRLVYHTPGPGDPTFVRRPGDEADATQIFSAPAGLHSHFPLWSPDGAFIYAVQGSVPDRMDLWRIRPTGGAPERITSHAGTVSHPVFLDRRTLVYLSTDESGSGPWIHSLDVERRVPHRATFGIDRYTSLAASRNGRRLVATLANPKGTLWQVPIGTVPAEAADARPIRLTTGNGSSPRIGDGFLLYVSSKGTSDSLRALHGDRATELWSARDARVTGGPALARDGRRIAFSTRRHDGRSQLWVINSDGTDARPLAIALELQGAPAWTPDGRALTVGAAVDGIPSLFSVPVDGGPAVRLVHEHSIDPAWSPQGGLLVFSGADVGTTFSVKAVAADGAPRRIPRLTLTRGARRVVFLPDGRSLVVMRGDLRHRNLWAIDLDTGTERQLTNFDPGFEIRDFDVAPDGRELVVEQIQEHSDIVLLDLPR